MINKNYLQFYEFLGGGVDAQTKLLSWLLRVETIHVIYVVFWCSVLITLGVAAPKIQWVLTTKLYILKSLHYLLDKNIVPR